MGSMASTVASIIFESCTFAALTRTASGMPWASTTRWRFVPCLPRSVGFLPVSWPPRGRHRGGVQRGPVPVDAIGLGQLFEKHLVQPAPDARLVPVSQPAPARHPAPNTPSRQASTPRGCPSSARTGSPSAPPGPTPGAVRPWASAAPAGAAARSAPRTHQATVPSPWHPPPWLLFCFLGCLRDGFVRRTKAEEATVEPLAICRRLRRYSWGEHPAQRPKARVKCA